jgi:hypothetical protein
MSIDYSKGMGVRKGEACDVLCVCLLPSVEISGASLDSSLTTSFR